MQKKGNTFLSCIITFCITFCICFLLLLISILVIPRDRISENIYKSSLYWEPFKPVYQWIDNNYKLSVDYYSDPLLFDILYFEDENHPVKSLLQNDYYDAVTGDEYKSATMLKEAIEKNKAPNNEYSRYWHGSAVFLRPLLLFFDCTQIYILNAVLLIILLALVLILLFRKGHKQLALALCIGLVSCNAFMVASCIQYTTMFLLCFVAVAIEYALLSLNFSGKLSEQKSKQVFLCFFTVLGLLTNFFDFLTVETMPFLTCLIVYFAVRYDKNAFQTFREELRFLVKAVVSFGLSYCSMWALKWILTTACTEVNAFMQAGEHSARWIVGGTDGKTVLQHIVLAISRNFGSLFPFSFMPLGVNVISVLLFIVLLCVIFLYRKEGKDFDFGRILLIILCFPILRFVVLNSHSYLHFTMTHRALLPLVMAMYLILRTQLIGKARKENRYI